MLKSVTSLPKLCLRSCMRRGLFPRAVHLTMGRAWEEQWTISSIQFDDNSTIKSIGSKTECYSIETSSESF